MGEARVQLLKLEVSRSDRALSIVFRGSWSIPSEHLGEARQLGMKYWNFGRISGYVPLNGLQKCLRVVLIMFREDSKSGSNKNIVLQGKSYNL